ncbi:MAG TPA: LptA/OstA family protein [Desulfomonilaceae bacterium]|nr:LptA/OstA family protein [Desulfomonilaceae bacterium]
MRRAVSGVAGFVLILLTVAAAAATNAESLSLGKGASQLEISSKKLTVKTLSAGVWELTFDGTVTAKQGDMTLSCDRMVVLYEEGKATAVKNEPEAQKKPKDLASSIKSAVALGNVKVVKNELTATAGKASFDNAKRTVTLTEGPPRVRQGPHVLAAPMIVIYLDESRAELLGVGDKNGVTGILNPAQHKKEN